MAGTSGTPAAKGVPLQADAHTTAPFPGAPGSADAVAEDSGNGDSSIGDTGTAGTGSARPPGGGAGLRPARGAPGFRQAAAGAGGGPGGPPARPRSSGGAG